MNRSPLISPSAEPQNGFLTVRVRTAGNALPVPGAVVTVLPAAPSSSPSAPPSTETPSPPPPAVLITDASGNTPLLPLPSVSPSASLSPGGGEAAKRYHVIVEAPGYERTQLFYLPIYPGITALQTVSLLPLPGSAPDGAASTQPAPGQNYDLGVSPDL